MAPINTIKYLLIGGNNPISQFHCAPYNFILPNGRNYPLGRNKFNRVARYVNHYSPAFFPLK